MLHANLTYKPSTFQTRWLPFYKHNILPLVIQRRWCRVQSGSGSQRKRLASGNKETGKGAQEYEEAGSGSQAKGFRVLVGQKPRTVN